MFAVILTRLLADVFLSGADDGHDPGVYDGYASASVCGGRGSIAFTQGACWCCVLRALLTIFLILLLQRKRTPPPAKESDEDDEDEDNAPPAKAAKPVSCWFFWSGLCL